MSSICIFISPSYELLHVKDLVGFTQIEQHGKTIRQIEASSFLLLGSGQAAFQTSEYL